MSNPIEHDIYSGDPQDLVAPVQRAKPEDNKNPSFTKKGPGRKPAKTSKERRQLRAIRRPGVQPEIGEVKANRRHLYLHSHARNRLAERKAWESQLANAARDVAEAELTGQAG